MLNQFTKQIETCKTVQELSNLVMSVLQSLLTQANEKDAEIARLRAENEELKCQKIQ